jgi:predicted P-loop ATPase
MAIKPNWFTDSLPLNARNQETLEHVEGKLFVECAELQGMKKGEIEHVKAMLSRTVDRGRPAYGRLQKERARQFVFIGTSNGQSYLRDETGNRRFWPVAVKTFDVAALKRDRDQIWAEAAFVEDMGESIRLDPSLWEAAGIEQRRRLEIVADPYTDAFRHYLGDRAGKIATPDLWAILGIDDAGRRTPDQNKRFGAALKACGWQAKTIWVGGQSTRGYVRGVQSGPEGWRRIVVTRGPDRRPLVEYDDERETPSDSFET